MPEEVRIHIKQGNLDLQASASIGENLKTFVQRNVPLPSPCGGVGTCGKCRVMIVGMTAPITQNERDYFSEQELNEGFRLACMQKVSQGMNLTVPYYPEKMQAAVDTNFDIAADKAGVKPKQSLGIAVDIGTTTVAAYLYDLKSGKQLGQKSAMNAQKSFGADVISRIQFSMEHEGGTAALQNSIIQQLNLLMSKLMNSYGRSLTELAEMCIAANTTMLHFLVGAEARGIAVAPFTPEFLESKDIPAEDLGLNFSGNVHLISSISAYVGADITAGIISSGIDQAEKPCLLIDIGTNGEMVLGNKEGLLACSAAAGPAFEGASIYDGVGGIEGAISVVDLAHDPMYRTIGGKPPIGICGSGVLDCFAQLYQHGIVDETGRMLDPEEIDNPRLSARVIEHDEGLAFVLVDGDSQGQKQILFTAKDVREVQLAKAAIRAGMETLIHTKGLSYDDLDTLFLAGGFGNFLDDESALVAGLLPKEMEGRIIGIGNASGRGAALNLLQDETRARAKEIARNCDYVELSHSALFMNYYVEYMGYPE